MCGVCLFEFVMANTRNLHYGVFWVQLIHVAGQVVRSYTNTTDRWIHLRVREEWNRQVQESCECD